MSITADRLRAGMSIIRSRLMVTVESVTPDRDGMITAFIRTTTGRVRVRFHQSEHLTVSA